MRVFLQSTVSRFNYRLFFLRSAPNRRPSQDSFTAVVEAEEAAEAETDLVVDEGEAVAAPEAATTSPTPPHPGGFG